ncbi:MAG: protease modulator HflC, partial [Acidobacteria bacterium]|nr:protease modulator HflC [Acidobacteriota bacterium]
AYNRSRESQSFYAFLKSMETLEATVDPETLLVLSSGGEFYGYLKRSGGS